nr:immunoglobulin light chain junction region [Macaca mulatta]MOW35844.1 immunoglobulin light chain junction region [Macaca mulatta]
CQKYDDSPYSF